MISLNNLIADFEYSRQRTLYRSMNDAYFDMTMTYIPIINKTNFLNHIKDLELTIQFILFSTEPFDSQGEYFVNVIKCDEKYFNIQTMQIIVKRVYPISVKKYIDILPPIIENKKITTNNIKMLEHQIKAFEFFYPK